MKTTDNLLMFVAVVLLLLVIMILVGVADSVLNVVGVGGIVIGLIWLVLIKFNKG